MQTIVTIESSPKNNRALCKQDPMKLEVLESFVKTGFHKLRCMRGKEGFHLFRTDAKINDSTFFSGDLLIGPASPSVLKKVRVTFFNKR